MSAQRYERVSANDNDSPLTPISPPPSFRSRTSSPTSRHTANSTVNQNLADTFDADGSDSDEDNDGDDRQRLMRGTPSISSAEQQYTPQMTLAETRPVVETRSTYVPVFAPQPASTGRVVYGGGSGSDGVFANLSAKPEPGEKTEEHPPTYEQAAADAAPPYWENTILGPGSGSDEVYIEGLPVGSFFSFVWNAMISLAFPIVGFLLTYLLHTTHAAKNGSLAGLGVTLINYGFDIKGALSNSPSVTDPSDPNYQQPSDPNNHNFDPNAAASSAAGGSSSVSSGDWFAYGLMIVGWFILIRSVSDFVRARRMEQLVLQSPERGLNVPVIAVGEGDETVV